MKQQEFFDLADKLEKKCGDWENSKGMSMEAKARLIAKVEQMDRVASEKPEITGRRKCACFKKRYAVVLAATLMLLMGMGVVGGRAWISDSTDMERESEITTKVNNEEKESVLREAEGIYQEIAEKLGIVPMRLGYIPEGMELDSYVIIEDTGWAYLYYIYNTKLITVKMGKLSEESSSNVQWDGAYSRLGSIDNRLGYEIQAYCIDAENENYAASVTYGNGYYNISGFFEDKEQFLEILEKIYFKNM